MAMTQAEIQDAIMARVGEDGEFRARLVADPRAAIQEVTGEPVPATVTVQVHEESATSFHLVLPSGSRLTEAEMAQVLGGGGDTAGGGVSCTTGDSRPLVEEQYSSDG